MPSLTVSISCNFPGCAGALPLIVHCRAPGAGVHAEVSGDGNPSTTGSALNWYEKAPVNASPSASAARYSTGAIGVLAVRACALHITTPFGGVQVHAVLLFNLSAGRGAIATKSCSRKRSNGSSVGQRPVKSRT